MANSQLARVVGCCPSTVDRKLDRMGRPDPRAIEKSTSEIFENLIGDQRHVAVYTDQHKHSVRPQMKYGDQVTHIKTSSQVHRGHYNNLFAVNRHDMMLRHGSKNHTRETIAFSKRRQAGILGSETEK